MEGDGVPERDPSLPESVGRYSIESELGRGGQGAVFLARDPRLDDRRVALKVLPPSMPMHLVERFEREAALTSRLDHPGICPVYEAGEENGVSYIAMRYVEGQSLEKLIANGREVSDDAPTTSVNVGPRSRADVESMLLLFERAARALHAAHELGLVHRDIKPGNIMVDERGHPVLVDFGLASDGSDEEKQLTFEGDLLGTPAYMSPEQLLAQRIALDRRTDIYSLGVSLYEALTLELPFDGATRDAIYKSILTSELPDPRRANKQLTKDVRVVLETACDKDRDRRYQTALDLAEDLRRVREFKPIRARPIGALLRFRRWTQRRPALATGVFALFLMLGVGLAIALAMLAEVRKREAETRDTAEYAKALALAAEAREVVEVDPYLALLLAREAVATRDSARTRSALASVLASAIPAAEVRLPGSSYPRATPFGRDRMLLYGNGSSLLTCTARGEVLERIELDAPIRGVAVSPDQGQFVTVPAGGGPLRLWTRGETEPIEIGLFEGSSSTWCYWARDSKAFYVYDYRKRSADGNNIHVVFDREGSRLGEFEGPVSSSRGTDRLLRIGDDAALLDRTGKVLAELPSSPGTAAWSRDGTRFVHHAPAKDGKPRTERLYDRNGELLATWPDTKAWMLFSEPARVITLPKGGAPAVRDGNGTLLKQLEGGSIVPLQSIPRAMGQTDSPVVRVWSTVADDRRTTSIRDLHGDEVASFTAVEQPTRVQVLGDRVLVQEGRYAVLRDRSGKALRQVHGTGFLMEPGFVQVRTDDGSLRVFDSDGREALAVRSAAHTSLHSFSHDGRYAFSTSADGVARVYDLEAPAIPRFEPKTATIRGAQIAGNGTLVAIWHADGRVSVFDLTGKLLYVLEHDKREGEGTIPPIAGRQGVIFNGSNKEDRILSLASTESSVRLWDLDGNVLSRFEDLEVIHAWFLGDDRVLTNSTVEKGPPHRLVRTQVWDRNGKSPVVLGTFATGLERSFPAIALPKGKGFLTMSDEPERVQLLDGDGRFVAKLDTPGELEIIKGNLYIPARGDGERFLVGSHHETTWYLTLFDLRGRRVGEPLSFDSLRYVIPAAKPDRFITYNAEVRDFELWSFDGERIAPLRLAPGSFLGFYGGVGIRTTGQAMEHTELFDLDGKPVGRIPGNHYGFQVDVGRRRMVPWMSQTPVVSIWDLDGKEVARLVGHTSKPNVRVSKDMQRIVTFAQDKTIRLWTWDGELLLTLTGPAAVQNATLTPDGKHVLAWYAGHDVLLWPLDIEEIKRRADAAVHRDFTPEERARYPRLLPSR